MDGLVIAIIVFGSLFLFMFLGVPIAFTMGGLSIALGFVYLGVGPSLNTFVQGSYSNVVSFTLTAIPLFVFMAGILRYSELADEMFEAVYRWLGGVKGGLAAGSVGIGAIFGAIVGSATVATVTLGVTARPIMLQKGYDNKLVLGSIMSAGTLGIIIPPSVLMIIYGMVAGVSVGKMFAGGIVPGIISAILFAAYCIISSYINPHKGPALSKAERYSWKEKFVSLKGVILPVFVIFCVLGSILFGIATPTEGAVVGVLGSLVCAALKRKLNFNMLKKVFKLTTDLVGAVFFLLIGAAAYSKIVAVSGLAGHLTGFIAGMDADPIIVLIAMQVLFFFLGMLIDPTAILFITAPVLLPVASLLGFDLIWYGVLFAVNMCMAYMTPPFGLSFFLMKGLDSTISLKDCYLGALPFDICYTITIILLIIFPALVLWPTSLIV